MDCPSHPPCLGNLNDTWSKVQIMKLLISHFSPVSYTSPLFGLNTKVYPKVSGLAAWSENANGTALCYYMQLYSCFMSQSSEFCRHNPLCCSSASVYCCRRIFRYDSVRKLLDTPSFYPRYPILKTLSISYISDQVSHAYKTCLTERLKD